MPNGENRFDVNTLLSVDSPRGYNRKAQLFRDEQSYAEALAESKVAKELYSDICLRLRKANTYALRVISTYLKQLNL